MHAEPTRRIRRLRAAAAAAVATLALASGCTPSGPGEPTPTSPSASPTPRDFTVLTTEKPGTFDPAAAVSSADATVALDVFQRLMVVQAGGPDLKPDAATDCLYTSPTVYECKLTEGLVFSNGNKLTAADVKFSIDRAYRLGIDGTSVTLLNSLQRVEKVDDLTVRFHLKWADSQFGFALATPAASIVDEQTYDPDAVRGNDKMPVGSGPYALAKSDAGGLTFTRIQGYQGATTGVIDRIRLAYAADSPAVEQAMTGKTVDAVWRGLDTAAVARMDAEAAASQDRRTKGGYAKTELHNTRMQRLIWNPSSSNRARADLRVVVSQALQADRTLTSLVPPASTESVASFPAGGRPTIKQPSGERVKLTLTYDSHVPDEGDLARLLRDRLEERGGLSVLLKPDSGGTDLVLTDKPAWVNIPFGWLQPYLDAPLPGSKAKLAHLDQSARETSDANAREALLGEIQQQAAADLTVLPMSLGPQTLYLSQTTSVAGDPFGPAWQLGLWSFRRA